MGKFRFKIASAGENIFGYYSDLEAYRNSRSSVTLLDGDGGKINLKGKGFVVNEENELVAGTITSATFGTEDGPVLATFTGGHSKATQIPQNGSIGSFELFYSLLNFKDTVVGTNYDDYLYGSGGNDVLNGRGGRDHINGGDSNDRMTGGKGTDIFVFAYASGKDVIKDFDPNGGNNFQDFLDIDDGYTAIQKGHNLFLDFGGGYGVLLIGVSKNDIDASDFL